jgi:hypothetical protein
MAPLIPSAKATLAYPLFACDFDPLDSSRLFVAGGGGAGRSGVPNRIVSLSLCVLYVWCLSKTLTNAPDIVRHIESGRAQRSG